MVIATPEIEDARVGHRQISTSPMGDGVRRAVNPLARPNPGWKEMPALRRHGRFTNTAVPKFASSSTYRFLRL